MWWKRKDAQCERRMRRKAALSLPLDCLNHTGPMRGEKDLASKASVSGQDNRAPRVASGLHGAPRRDTASRVASRRRQAQGAELNKLGAFVSQEGMKHGVEPTSGR